MPPPPHELSSVKPTDQESTNRGGWNATRSMQPVVVRHAQICAIIQAQTRHDTGKRTVFEEFCVSGRACAMGRCTIFLLAPFIAGENDYNVLVSQSTAGWLIGCVYPKKLLCWLVAVARPQKSACPPTSLIMLTRIAGSKAVDLKKEFGLRDWLSLTVMRCARQSIVSGNNRGGCGRVECPVGNSFGTCPKATTD